MVSYDDPECPIRHLTRTEFENGKDTFDSCQGIGRYDARKLEEVLQSIGVAIPMDMDLRQYMQSVAPVGVQGQGVPGFPLMEFLLLMDKIKGDHLANLRHGDADMLDAFVALGGHSDKSGGVPIGVLRSFGFPERIRLAGSGLQDSDLGRP